MVTLACVAATKQTHNIFGDNSNLNDQTAFLDQISWKKDNSITCLLCCVSIYLCSFFLSLSLSLYLSIYINDAPDIIPIFFVV
jgi:hypothetical protein